MSKTYNENVHFAGGLSIGNLAMGMFTVQPPAREVMSIDVSGINLLGSGEMVPFAQVHTAWPWYSASVACVHTSDTSDEDPTDLWDTWGSGFRIVWRRTNNSETNVSWCAWKMID